MTSTPKPPACRRAAQPHVAVAGVDVAKISLPSNGMPRLFENC